MIFMNLFKRKNIGFLLESVGLVIFCLFLAAFIIIAYNVYVAKGIQAHFFIASNYASAIASQARLMHEQTGQWPVALADIQASKKKAPPEIARIELLEEGKIRAIFASPPSIANSTLTLKVIVRGSEHFLECRGDGEFMGALPPSCVPGEEPLRFTWPPKVSNP